MKSIERFEDRLVFRGFRRGPDGERTNTSAQVVVWLPLKDDIPQDFAHIRIETGDDHETLVDRDIHADDALEALRLAFQLASDLVVL